MKRHPALIMLAFGLSVLLLSGCVPYRRYDQLKGEHTRLKKIHDDLVAKYNHVVRELNVASKDGQIGKYIDGELNEKTRRISELEDLIAQIEQENTRIVPFPQDAADNLGPGVHVTREGAISLGQDILFRPGVADLKTSASSPLNGVADVLRTQYSGEIFHIVGHTDNVPLRKTKGRWGTNHRLGFERAYTVFNFLTRKEGLPESQFVLHSYSYLNPVDETTKDTKSGQALNRRVEIYRAGTKL